MTPHEMAALHARAFAPERGWQVQEFTNLLASPRIICCTDPSGFALVRFVADEAELLTLAVVPEARRQGIASKLIRQWMNAVPATTAFLEVAEDNHAAQALYAKHGFAIAGRRKAYYHRPGAEPVDALLMQAALTRGQTDQ